jgi:two-component system chemotaxis response regulator CheY
MIVIEERAEERLIERLEWLRDNTQSIRCIEAKFSSIDASQRLSKQALVTVVQSIFPDDLKATQLYFLMDGDVVILLDMVSAKQMRQLAAQLPVGSEHYLKLYEFQHQLNHVIIMAQAKLDADFAKREVAKLREQHAMHERRRQQVLNFTIDDSDRERIATLRAKRSMKELMIVEDDAFSRRLLENILPKHHRITAVGEPDAALERYVLMVPDVLFLDIDLPDVNGHELLEKILSIDPQAYVIMISGNSDRDNVIRAMSHGARGFIAKPYARERINEYLQRCPTLNNNE